MPSNNALAVEAKHQRFRMAYERNGGNATQAAIEAGYSQKSAHVIGCNLLKRLNLRAASDARQLAAVENSGLRSEEVFQAIRRALLADPRKLFDKRGKLRAIQTLDDDTALAIHGVDVVESGGKGLLATRTNKVRFVDRMAAADKAARILGLYEQDNRQRAPSLAIQINVEGPPPRTRRDDDD